jgi:hypothetical protein
VQLCVRSQTHSVRQCCNTIHIELQTCTIAQLMAFKELGIKVEDIVAYINEQVCSTALACRLRQLGPDPDSGSALVIKPLHAPSM